MLGGHLSPPNTAPARPTPSATAAAPAAAQIDPRSRRVSTGSLPYRAAMFAATKAAVAVRDSQPIPESLPYSQMQTSLHAYDRR